MPLEGDESRILAAATDSKVPVPMDAEMRDLLEELRDVVDK